jgi:argininosuccinate lyase
VPFRDAHEIVGNTVHYAIEQGKPLEALSLEELQGVGPMITQDVFAVLTLEGSVNARDHIGGTAPRQVKMAVKAAQQHLDEQSS